jgi:coenzyme PQQ precursor peptide PqqA
MVSVALPGSRRRFMKIMRFESCCRGWVAHLTGSNIRNGTRVSPRCPPGRRATRQETSPMQWNTPTAIDFRFGFEITMYVANR